MKIISEKKMQE